MLVCVCVCVCVMVCRAEMNEISVTDLSKGDDDVGERTPPNPIQTFQQAFAHYRTSLMCNNAWYS